MGGALSLFTSELVAVEVSWKSIEVFTVLLVVEGALELVTVTLRSKKWCVSTGAAEVSDECIVSVVLEGALGLAMVSTKK